LIEHKLRFDKASTKEKSDKDLMLSRNLIKKLKNYFKDSYLTPKDTHGNPKNEHVFLGVRRRNVINDAQFYREWNDTCERLGVPFIVPGKNVRTANLL
jgi:hypothetical protein